MAERNLAPTWVTTAAFGFFTLNSGLAIYSARGDPASVLFVVGSYLALLLLFHCLRAYERVPPGSPERERARRAVLKAALWTLTTLLTAMFASRVGPLMPPAVGAVVWAMAAVTSAGGFWAFFLNP
ncbi:uncharacterized protein LOC101762849 [Setaria italica]|uniref:uncharacterized protein LOC101762849 n=1 Tax=Setaria italica TaxID=4555 RepID=UPI000350A280|nr:uncharacterized protein LOC101762849 [Setaria italica]